MANELEKQIIHVFNAWGKTLVRDTKKAIDTAMAADGGGQASKLSGSVNYKVLNEGGVISFSLTMNDYWKFQDSGVDGTQVKHGSKYKFTKKNLNQKSMLGFINARHFKIELSTRRKKVLKGIRTKGIRQGAKQLTIDQAKKSLAFILGRSIAKKGIKPKKFMDKVITDERMNELKQMLAPLIRDAFVLEIKSALQ
jgi:hypothetical protein